MNTPSQLYLKLVRRRCGSYCIQWWDAILVELAKPFPLETFELAFARASRMIGSAMVELSQDEQHSLSVYGIPFLNKQPSHEIARIALLLHGIPQISHENHAEFLDSLFSRGDTFERIALLRSFSLLPNPSRFLHTAVEACRTNIQTVFEAIACENPYPARYFPELNFNQLVMKAVFTGVSLRRIVGLTARVTPALTMMAGDHVKEWTAAGRPVHEDVALITNHKG